MRMGTRRVGFVGAGPVAQAIHLPTLARLGDAVRVTEVMDVDEALAAAVAAPHGARVTTSLDGLLAGDGVDIAVVCSPNAFHVPQIEALAAAGVAGILAEKPVAMTHDEADRVAAAVAASGTALVVGAMHTYDPAWLAARDALEARGPLAARGPFHVRSAVYIPTNDHFEDMATTMVRPPRPGGAPPTAADVLRGGVMGLAIHNLPLVRVVLPRLDEVAFAAQVEPWGYAITATGPAGSVDLLARTGGTWQPDWTLSFWGRDTELELELPPSYVHSGSAVARLRGPDGDQRVFGPYPVDGYDAEWRELLAVLDGRAPRYDVAHLMADVAYAIDLADGAVAALAAEPTEVAR
jgi:predicted dehydrogenase